MIRRQMAELMVDFAVDKNGNLKSSPEEYLTPKMFMSRQAFMRSLNQIAKNVISDNNLFDKQPPGLPKMKRPLINRGEKVSKMIDDMLKNGSSVDEISETLDVDKNVIGSRAKKMGLSRYRRETGSKRRKLGAVTGRMSVPGGAGNNSGQDGNQNNAFVPRQMPPMSKSLADRIKFVGKLSTYDRNNYTSRNPRYTLSEFRADKDEPHVVVDATFGGSIQIKEGRFWDLYQPIAVALSNAVTKRRTQGQPKRFISVGGAPGSGKSTLRFSGKHGIPLPDESVHIDADEIKTVIPEAIEMHKAGNPHWGDSVHEESRIIADIGLKVALENEHDVVYDSTGQFNSGFGTLKSARAKGYEIVLHYNVAPQEILESRITEREKNDARRLPRHIIHAVYSRNFDIMPKVAKSADEFYLWDTDVPDGTEPVLLARKLKGKNLEILDAKAYYYGNFDPTGQAVDLSKPDFKVSPRKVAKDSYDGQIITDYESGMSVADIAKKRNATEGAVFDSITRNEIDPTMKLVAQTAPPRNAPPTQQKPQSNALTQESLNDAQAATRFASLLNSDKAILLDFIAKKPGVSLDQMNERVPMDLVIWASSQKPEHIRPMSQVRSIEKLESMSGSKRQRMTEMIQSGESIADIANELDIPFSVISVAIDFVDQYGYIPEGGDVEEKSATFANVSSKRKARLLGKAIKAKILNGEIVHER
jgi:predicted ABC-type ATPase